MAIDMKQPGRVEFNEIVIPINASLRRVGYPAHFQGIPDYVKGLFDEMCGVAADLIEPQGAYIIIKINEHRPSGVVAEMPAFTIQSAKVARLLSTAAYAALFMVTIGPRLEGEVKTLFEQGEATKGFLLDAIGSETADEVARVMHRLHIRRLVREQGYAVTARFSPGYGDWRLDVQKSIADLCGAEAIGISVNDHYLLTPKKSVSAVVGLVNLDG